MKFIVKGKQSFGGEVVVSGAKNSATRLLCGALLTDQDIRLDSFPTQLYDTVKKVQYLQEMGVEITVDDAKSVLKINAKEMALANVGRYDLTVRTTYLLAAATLVREAKAKVPYPGGCKIGNRGYDLHMMVWRDLGCEVVEKEDYISVKGKLKGGTIRFPITTVGGTENALLCGSVAEGTTIIENAYITPEVLDLIGFLRKMGARITVQGTSHIVVEGANGLLGGTTYSVMPDRIEALTWMVLAAVTNSTLTIKNVNFEDLEIPLIHLRDAGVNVFSDGVSTALVTPDSIGEYGIQPFEVACGTHPGVISDMQSFYVFLALFANGRSTIFDYRYPERIAYARELAKFAPGHIKATEGKIVVDGPVKLQAVETDSTDLRGSMALAMAAICAEGTSQVNDIEMALRGYNDLPGRLADLGIICEWVNE